MKLYVGDQIKFGDSTRTYILNGPESQERQESDQAAIPKFISKAEAE